MLGNAQLKKFPGAMEALAALNAGDIPAASGFPQASGMQGGGRVPSCFASAAAMESIGLSPNDSLGGDVGPQNHFLYTGASGMLKSTKVKDPEPADWFAKWQRLERSKRGTSDGEVVEMYHSFLRHLYDLGVPFRRRSLRLTLSRATLYSRRVWLTSTALSLFRISCCAALLRAKVSRGPSRLVRSGANRAEAVTIGCRRSPVGATTPRRGRVGSPIVGLRTFALSAARGTRSFSAPREVACVWSGLGAGVVA